MKSAIAEVRERYSVSHRLGSCVSWLMLAGSGIYAASVNNAYCFPIGIAAVCISFFYLGWNASHASLILVQEEMDAHQGETK